MINNLTCLTLYTIREEHIVYDFDILPSIRRVVRRKVDLLSIMFSRQMFTVYIFHCYVYKCSQCMPLLCIHSVCRLCAQNLLLPSVCPHSQRCSNLILYSWGESAIASSPQSWIWIWLKRKYKSLIIKQTKCQNCHSFPSSYARVFAWWPRSRG